MPRNNSENPTALGLAMRAGRLPAGLHFAPETENGQDLEDDVDNNQETQEEGADTNGRIKALEQNQVLNSLLQDPDVLAVIKAKREGKKVKVAADESEDTSDETPPEPEDDLSDVPQDDPLRKTLERISELVDKKLSRHSQNLGIDKLGERLNSVENLATHVQKKEIAEQVKAVATKYSDFGEYKAKILELSQSLPGLGVEELYIIAKSRLGKLKLNEPSTFSERPTAHPRRMVPRDPKKPARPSGKKGFSSLLSEALDKVDFSGVE